MKGAIMKYTVKYKDKEVKILRLPNGKFKKPNVSQFTKQGLGCAWLDDCRIPYNCKENTETVTRKPSKLKKDAISYVRQDEPLFCGTGHHKGRFPANVICEDDVLDDGIERKTGDVKPHPQEPSLFCTCNKHTGSTKGDTGSYSRYFSLDAWFVERIKDLPKEAQKTFPWLIVPKESVHNKNKGLEDISDKDNAGHKSNFRCKICGHQKNSGTPCQCVQPEWDEIKLQKTKNNHPTCKPIKLMSWLITLASREGDIVLDPFCGSGTTCCAAKALGRQYIGIEREAEYVEIARKRLDAIPDTLDKWTNENKQVL